MPTFSIMKTVSKIDPEFEYKTAKDLINNAFIESLTTENLNKLGSSVDSLITVTRVLIEREMRRRGPPTPPKNNSEPKGRKKGETRADLKKLPSERYPNLEIKEETVEPASPPICNCCEAEMSKTGLFDVTEKLEVIPKRYYISRQKREKYNCQKCHSGIASLKPTPSIIPQSNYGDSVIIDAALSKYCDLLPMERYTSMAARLGLRDLPPHSLIGCTHILAFFLNEVVKKIKIEVLISRIIHGDETSHNMLEGDETTNWFLWGFYSPRACYFEVHNTRSGDVVKSFLKYSSAEIILSDGYPGYQKAVREIKEDSGRVILEALCNAHACRYFKESGKIWKDELEKILESYGKIYELEAEKKN
jgi:transposase